MPEAPVALRHAKMRHEKVEVGQGAQILTIQQLIYNLNDPIYIELTQYITDELTLLTDELTTEQSPICEFCHQPLGNSVG
jgi:hypothetical protein